MFKEVWTLSGIFQKFKELLTPAPLENVIIITKKGSDPKYPCLRILALYSEKEKAAIPDKFFKRFQAHCWPE